MNYSLLHRPSCPTIRPGSTTSTCRLRPIVRWLCGCEDSRWTRKNKKKTSLNITMLAKVVPATQYRESGEMHCSLEQKQRSFSHDWKIPKTDTE